MRRSFYRPLIKDTWYKLEFFQKCVCQVLISMFSVFIQISWTLILSVNLQIAIPCHLMFNSFIFASLASGSTQGLAPYIFVADNESRLLFFVPRCKRFRAMIRVTNNFRSASESHNISFTTSHFFPRVLPLSAAAVLSSGNLRKLVHIDIYVLKL
jgi:hypothetical protein